MRKPKRSARIYSNDAKGTSIEINLTITSENGLESSEVATMTCKAARAIADSIRSLPYADFGPENTQIKL